MFSPVTGAFVILGIAQPATEDEINAAYLDRVNEYNESCGNKEPVIADIDIITEAYEALRTKGFPMAGSLWTRRYVEMVVLRKMILIWRTYNILTLLFIGATTAIDYATSSNCVPAAMHLCQMTCRALIAVCLLVGIAVERYLRFDPYLNKLKLQHLDQYFRRCSPHGMTALVAWSKKAWCIVELAWLIYKAKVLWSQVSQDLTNTKVIEQFAITLKSLFQATISAARSWF